MTFPSWAAGKSNVPYRRSAGEIALPGDCLLRKRGRAMLVPTRSFLRARHSERSEESVSVRRRRVRRRRRTANAEQSVPPGRRGRRPLRNVGIVAHAVHRYDGVGARRRFRVFSILFLQSDWKYDMISLRHYQILSLKVCVLPALVKTHASASCTFGEREVDCVAAIGVVCFSAYTSVCAFFARRLRLWKKNTSSTLCLICSTKATRWRSACWISGQTGRA